jgi:hypothetical protein
MLRKIQDGTTVNFLGVYLIVYQVIHLLAEAVAVWIAPQMSHDRRLTNPGAKNSQPCCRSR